MVVVLAVLCGGFSEPKRAIEMKLAARVVAGLVANAGVAGLLKGECPALGQVVAGRRVDLGGEAGEAEDGGSVKSTTFALGGRSLDSRCVSTNGLRDHPAWPQ
jgi:hypothetical protein